MQRKILVFGANGQLGREIMDRAGDAATGFDRASVDISDAAAVRQAVLEHPPSAIVNAAGYTAVDQAETEIDAALRTNRHGAAVLAEAGCLGRRALCSDLHRLCVRRRETNPLSRGRSGRSPERLWAEQGGRRANGPRRLPTTHNPAHVLGVQSPRHELRPHHAAARRRAAGAQHRRRSNRMPNLCRRSRRRDPGDLDQGGRAGLSTLGGPITIAAAMSSLGTASPSSSSRRPRATATLCHASCRPRPEPIRQRL